MNFPLEFKLKVSRLLLLISTPGPLPLTYASKVSQLCVNSDSIYLVTETINLGLTQGE